MLGISGWAIGAGDPMNIIAPFDSDGHRCGAKDTEYELFPYKHFTSLITNTGAAASAP
jgi:hypothetical protein|tara:strand:+ start:330 stop:503 length:174 start_codon:yes stop_codon:yes gene_type:complete